MSGTIGFSRRKTFRVVNDDDHRAFSVSRAERRRFLQSLSYGSPGTGKTIFLAPSWDGPMPKVHIKVVFDLDWPADHPIVGDLGHKDFQHAVGGTIFRVKGLIEQSLLQEIELYDIKVGCITVRFRVLEPVTQALMRAALARLWDTRKLYSVIDVSGHINGRALAIA